jgi:hypothetical protein
VGNAPKIVVSDYENSDMDFGIEPNRFTALSANQGVGWSASDGNEAETGDIIKVRNIIFAALEKIARWFLLMSMKTMDLGQIERARPGSFLGKMTQF